MTGPSALLLVDVQEDFLARPGLTPDRLTFIATVSRLLAHARSEGWLVVHVHSRVHHDRHDAMPHRRASGSAEAVAGTAGIEAPPELAPAGNEPLLYKRFFSAFDSPGLENLLRSHCISQLMVAGVHAHACIRDTVNDAYRLGFEVIVPGAATASYDPAHAAQALHWMNGRSARIVQLPEIVGDDRAVAHWTHRDPCNEERTLGRIRLTPAGEAHQAALDLASRQGSSKTFGVADDRDLLVKWREWLGDAQGRIRDMLARDIAKPLQDADGEIAYGLGLLDALIDQLGDEEERRDVRVCYRPRGVVGIITPWNNPFAIALGKIAPALGFGNAVLWKPALPATNISLFLARSLEACGFADRVRILPGDAGTADAIVSDENVAALSFTGSSAVGERLIARAGIRQRVPAIQAELGGSNAAIVDSNADIEPAARDLAAAMFSFSGQRCTAIRRIIVVGDIGPRFIEALVGQTRALKLGFPADPETDLGPVIDRAIQKRLLTAVARAVADGGKLICGGTVPSGLPAEGCWIEPTLVDRLSPGHDLVCEEWFGPIGCLMHAKTFDEALVLHNQTRFGLLGALYSNDRKHIAAFTARASAGLLSIGRARPSFSCRGPFGGWNRSGYGIPEHGQWNREFYAQTQAVYGG